MAAELISLVRPRMKRSDTGGTLVIAARLLIVVLLCVVLYWGSPVLVPVALALMLNFILSPSVRWLQRRRIPKIAAVLVVVTLSGAGIATLLWIVSSQVTTLVADIPDYRGTIKEKIADVRGLSKGGSIEKIQSTIEEVSEEIEAEEEAEEDAQAAREARVPRPDAEEPVPVRVVPGESLLGLQDLSGMTPVAAILGQAGLVLVLVVLLLIAEDDLRSRVAALAGEEQLAVTTSALNEAGSRISRYLATQLSLNAGYGIVVGVGLALLEIPYPVLWGVCAAVFRYLPYVGPWVAAALPIAITMIISDGWWPVVWVVSLFIVLELISNNVLEPWLYGRSVGVPAFVLLSAAAFWTWLWGPVGLVLSTPLTVCLVALGEHVNSLRILSQLFGSGTALPPHLHIYQRLLARDEEAATEVIRRRMPENGSREETVAAADGTCRDVLAPLLTMIRRDHRAGVLDDARENEMLDFVEKQTGLLAVGDEGSAGGGNSSARILLLPAADEIDSAAANVLARVLKNDGASCRVLSPTLLASEVVDAVRAAGSRVLCIVAVGPDALPTCLRLCKRMSRLDLDARIAANFWSGLTADDRKALIEAGADLIADGLEEGDRLLAPLDQFFKSAAARRAAQPVAAAEPEAQG